jgi:hypothetical protein
VIDAYTVLDVGLRAATMFLVILGLSVLAGVGLALLMRGQR